MNNLNLPNWVRLPPDVQDALISDLEAHAKPVVVTDAASLWNEAARVELAEKIGAARFVSLVKGQLKSIREKR